MRDYKQELLDRAYKVAEKGEFWEYDKFILIETATQLLDSRKIDQEFAIKIDQIAELNTFY